MAASMAIVNAGPTSPVSCETVRCGSCGCGMAALSSPKRAPIVSTGRCIALTTTVVTISATNGPGILCDPRPDHDDRQCRRSDADGCRCDGRCMVDVRAPLGEKFRRHGAHLQAEEIFDLAREDDDGDPAREAGDHRMRDELDRAAELRESHDDEQHASHQRRHREPVDAVLLHDAVDDHDERAGRSADLNARAAERGDDEAGDDGGPQTAAGGDAAGDREGDGEWERDDADDDAGREVAAELRAGVVPERRD